MSDITPPPPPPPSYPPVPQPYEAAPQPPNNNLVLAILSTVLCCLPLGIVSIVKAAEVNSKWAQGDYAGAQASADAAKKWAFISGGVMIGGAVLYLLFIAVIAAGA